MHVKLYTCRLLPQVSGAFRAAVSTMQWRKTAVSKLQDVLETHAKTAKDEGHLRDIEAEVEGIESQIGQIQAEQRPAELATQMIQLARAKQKAATARAALAAQEERTKHDKAALNKALAEANKASG